MAKHWMIALLAALALVAAGCNGDDVAEPDAPDVDEPDVDEPDADEPDVEEPDADEPDDVGDGGRIAEEIDLSGGTFAVGSKQFTEQLLLGQIAIAALEAAGADVEDLTGLGGTGEVRSALEAGEVDLYWEYTGTGWITILGEDTPVAGAEEQFEAVAERDLEENGIRWLAPAEPDNTYALALSQEVADDFGVTTVSELEDVIAERGDEVSLCMTDEFAVRDDGLPGMEEHYGFEFPAGGLETLDPGIIYTQVAEGTCALGTVFATDGRIAALELEVLEDDQQFFPVYNPAVSVREEVVEEFPQLEDLFAMIADELDTESLQGLNARIDVDGEEPEDVARDWLTEIGLLGG